MGRKRRDRQIAASCQRSDRAVELTVFGGLPIVEADPASSSTARPSTETSVSVRGQRWLIRSSLQLPTGRDPQEVDATAQSLGLDLAGLTLDAKAAMVVFAQAPLAHNLCFVEQALGLASGGSEGIGPERLKRVADAVKRIREAVA
jgi:hypothetical protein